MKLQFKNKKINFKIKLTKKDYIFWSTVFSLNNYELIKSLINGFFYKKKVRLGTI